MVIVFYKSDYHGTSNVPVFTHLAPKLSNCIWWGGADRGGGGGGGWRRRRSSESGVRLIGANRGHCYL